MRIDDQTTVEDYLVLGTWEAITLLGQARELCEAAELSEVIAKAEAILISVVSELPRALTQPTGATKLDDLGWRAERSPGVAQAQMPFDHRPRTRRRTKS